MSESALPVQSRTIQLPADDAYLPDQFVQWWYWTGHLHSADGRRFGFETTFFAITAEAGKLFEHMVAAVEDLSRLEGLLAIQTAHFALTDYQSKTFHSRVDYRPGPPRTVQDGFALGNLGGSVRGDGGDGRDILHGEVGPYLLDLSLTQARPPILHYDGQRHDYCFGGNTYYYSRELMQASGRLVVGDEPLEVSGTVWFDRQYGALAEAVLVGWQWFALQLDGNVQIMLFDFHLFPKERFGSYTGADGSTRTLGPDDFKVEVLEHWTSPHTGHRYPSRWRLEVEGRAMLVTPVVQDQELHEPWLFPKYWEGACTVEGDLNGDAYVELSGYYSL